MAILPFVLGLLVLFTGQLWLDRLPRDPVAWRLTATLPVLALPALWARVRGSRWLRTLDFDPRRVRLNELASRLSSPIAYGLWLFLGGGVDFLEEVSRHGPLVEGLATVVPLLVTELGRLTAAREAIRRCRARGIVPPVSMPLFARRGTLLFGLVLIGLHALVEMLESTPSLLAAVEHTMVGNTLAITGLATLLLLALPRLAVWILPTRRLRKSPLRQQLDFAIRGLVDDPKRVHLIDTESRLVNAALVGPAPSAARLMVTDGLVEALGPTALRGVLAHEIGHNRARHVAWLLLIAGLLPLVWIGPLSARFDALDPIWLSGSLAATVLGLLGLRAVMHRFEHEADVQSAMLLGSGVGVLEALSTVLHLNGDEDRASLRHPSLARRIGVVARWQSDAAYRERFARGGRSLRRRLAAVVALAVLGSVAVHIDALGEDQLSYAIARGDFVTARKLAGTDAEDSAELIRFCDLGAAAQPAPFADRADRARFTAIAEREADRATADGRLKDARAWIELGSTYGEPPTRQQLAGLLFDARSTDDKSRVRRIAEHLRDLRSATEPWRNLADQTLRELNSD